MTFQLTAGAIQKLMLGQDVQNPVFQMLGFKKIAASGGNDRYRLNISDGQHSHTFAMLATQLNHFIPGGQLTAHSVFRGDKVISNTVGDKKVIIILELTILAEGSKVPGGKIGNPIQWVEGAPGCTGASGAAGAKASTNGSGGAGAGAFYGKSSSSGAGAAGARNGSSGAAGAGGPDVGPTMPICDLTPYNNKCAIRARVTSKSDIRTWSNSKGDGKLFSCEVLDDTGEIRVTGFNAQVDQFYDMLEIGQVYYFKNFQIKAANRAFNKLAHDYEISMGNETEVYPCLDDGALGAIPMATYNFVEICEIEKLDKDSMIDVIGICKSVGDIQSFTSRAGKELKKRDLILVDKSKAEIILTLWGKQAEDFHDDPSGPVIAAKGAKVGDYQGRTLSCGFGSGGLSLNPDVREAHALRGWWDNGGGLEETKSLSGAGGAGAGSKVTPWKLVREATMSDGAGAAGATNVGADGSEYWMSKVSVMSIKRENVGYQACASANCQKKVVDLNNGLFRCEKCNKESPDFKWRLMLSVNFGDYSDNVWATVFQDQGELMLSSTADIVCPLEKDTGNAAAQAEFDNIIRTAAFKSWIVKFRSKYETFNNETRRKTQVVEAHAINYKELAQKLIAETKENSF